MRFCFLLRPLFFKLEALNVECKRLTKRRDQGFKVQKELFDTYELACKRLGEQPENVDGLNERVCFL